MRIAVRNQREFVAALNAQATLFGSDVEVVPLTFEQCKSVALGQLQGFDLVLASTDWVAGGAFLPLDDFVAELPGWPDAWHPAMRKLVSFSAHMYGIPYHDGPQVLHYRQDWISAEEIAIPTTWSDFVAVAKQFTDEKRERWGCCFAAYPDGHSSVYDFLLHLCSRGGKFLGESGEPLFNSEIGVEALTFLHDLIHVHGCASPECLTMNSVASGDCYAKGQVAMMWNWSGYALVANNPSVSEIVGLNACAFVPRGDAESGRHTSINSYWILGIPVSSGTPARAQEFMRFVSSPEMDILATQNGVSGVRLSTWESPEIQSRFPIFKLMSKVHDNSVCLPQLVNYEEVNQAVSQAVYSAVSGQVSPQGALREAAMHVREILK